MATENAVKRFAIVAAGIAAIVLGTAATAQEAFPSKPVRFVVPFAAGGALDYVARLMGDTMGKQSGVKVVVDNRAGGSGVIASEHVAKSAPDGYTVFMTNMDTHVNNLGMFKALPYDPIRDFQPLGVVVSAAAMLVSNASVPANNLQEFVNYAKSQQGGLSFGTWGNGSYSHLCGESFAKVNSLKVNTIPYKGETPLLQDLLGGSLTSGMASVLVAKGYVAKGQMKVYAVNGAQRNPLMPEVPTFRELGYTDPVLTMLSWFGAYAPAKTPGAVADRLNGLIRETLANADVAKSLSEKGFIPVGGSIAEHEATLRSQIPVITKIMRDIGIQPQ